MIRNIYQNLNQHLHDDKKYLGPGIDGDTTLIYTQRWKSRGNVCRLQSIHVYCITVLQIQNWKEKCSDLKNRTAKSKLENIFLSA